MFFNLAMLSEEGYKDFYAKNKKVSVPSFAYLGSPYYDVDGAYQGLVAAGNADYVDNGDGSFSQTVAGSGKYEKSYGPTSVQISSNKIDAYVDTINIMFLPDKARDHTIQLFVKTALSLAGMQVSYSSDGNYTFRSLQAKKTGKMDTCGVFPVAAGENVRFMGSNAFVVSSLEVDQRDSYSVKFRISARNEMNDEFKIYSVEMNSAGLWFEGGNDDA